MDEFSVLFVMFYYIILDFILIGFIYCEFLCDYVDLVYGKFLLKVVILWNYFDFI